LKHMFGCDKMDSRKEIWIKKADLFLLAGIFAAALILFLFFEKGRMPGSYASVSYDGQQILRLSLSQAEAQYFLVIWKPEAVSAETYALSSEKWEAETEALTGEAGAYNLFICGNGEIRMLRSSCPDLICVHHKAVSKSGESIICLPHKLSLEILGAQETEFDGITG